METHPHRTVLDLLHRDHYTPQEAAELLDISVNAIYQAAFKGDLRANIVGHDIVSIRRQDLITWLAERE